LRIVGPGGHRGVVVGLPGQQRLPVQVALALRAAHGDHVGQLRALGAGLQQVGDGGLVRDRHPRLAVLQPVGQGFRAEQHGQRHRDRPHLQHRQVGHRGLDALGHHDRDPVARPHA
jgi:hypothetical protein